MVGTNEKVTQNIHFMETMEHNDELLKEIIVYKVEKVVMEIMEGKSIGLGGFIINFSILLFRLLKCMSRKS